MIKKIHVPQNLQTNTWAFFLAFLALTSIQVSYIFGGLPWLDSFLFLLVPSFLFFLFSLFRPWKTETTDYCVSLTLVIACMVFALSFKSFIEVGTIDDGYHTSKMVALSINNSFFTKWHYLLPQEDARFYQFEFIESVWGVFWRWTRWDFIVIIIQVLPILVLWHQLLFFFRKQKVIAIPGLLAAVTVMSLALLWSQQGSTYNDSISGILGGIVLLLCYDLLKNPSQRRLGPLTALAFVSGLCMISKYNVLFIGLLGLGTSLVLGLQYLDISEKIILLLGPLPSVAYFLYFQGQIWIKKGNPFYPFDSKNMVGRDFNGWYHYYYQSHPAHLWVRAHAFNFKPFHVLVFWLMDYKFDNFLTADPWVRGNGLIFTYFVPLSLLLWFVKEYKNIFKAASWKNPCLFILGVTVMYYLFFDGSIGARMVIGFNIFILAWCLAWFWRNVECLTMKGHKVLTTVIACILIFLATGSYLEGILGKQFIPQKSSFLEAQRKAFPESLESK